LILVFGFYLYNSSSKTTTDLSDTATAEGVYEINIDTPIKNVITGLGYYILECSTIKYTNITVGGSIIPESSIKISDGHEKQILYVEGEKAKYFGAKYSIIQDDDSYLVIIRTHSASGLTEVISINKESGIGFDTKTLALGLSGGPVSDTYLTSCYEI